MNLVINIGSKEKFEQDYGDVMSLEEFIECCKSGSFIDYDGYARELLLNGHVISESNIYPSDVVENVDYLLDIQRKLGSLEIVWYNR